MAAPTCSEAAAAAAGSQYMCKCARVFMYGVIGVYNGAGVSLSGWAACFACVLTLGAVCYGACMACMHCTPTAARVCGVGPAGLLLLPHTDHSVPDKVSRCCGNLVPCGSHPVGPRWPLWA